MHIPISAALGIVHVPSEETTLGDWINTVQLLSISGYASLGNETAILLEDGTIYHNGDIWQLKNNGYEYRFAIDEVTRGRVHLTGIDRVELATETAEL